MITDKATAAISVSCTLEMEHLMSYTLRNLFSSSFMIMSYYILPLS